MSNHPSDPSGSPSQPLPEAKNSSASSETTGEDLLPSWDNPPMAMPVSEPIKDQSIPMAIPVSATDPNIPMAVPVPGKMGETVPLAMPVKETPEPEAIPEEVSEPAPQESAEPEAVAEPLVAEEPVPEPEPMAEPEPPSVPTSLDCPACTSSNPIGQPYCSDCGYYFSEADLAALRKPTASAAVSPSPTPVSTLRLNGRYERVQLISTRQEIKRYRGLDHGDGTTPPVPVIILEQAMPTSPPIPQNEPIQAESDSSDEILPSFDEPSGNPVTAVISGAPTWPSIAWERKLLRTLEHPCLPHERDYFCDETNEYLIEELPEGQLLWDAWDDPDAGADRKFGLLVEVADTMYRLHQCNAMLEAVRPEILVVDEEGKVHFADLSDLIPLPVPPGVALRGGLYTAPELLSGQPVPDARAALYSFGAMLYSLHVGRELNEKTDFDGPGTPKSFIGRFPDIHPAFGRLMLKTFRREVDARFPTDEAGKQDATGFAELIFTLETLRRTYDNVRLEVASWTNTGIIRSGNEDAFALMHATESRQDDLGESVLIILCDGMGGYEAGEIAAAMTIQSIRQSLTQLRPFSTAAGTSPFLTDPQTQMSQPGGHKPPPLNIDDVKKAMKQALRDANKLVFQTSRAPGSKRRGMGCTAEIVYIDGQNVVVGHVGDSRTYHLHEGRLIQMTRDQTLVNRLVELGTISAEDAEKHPRRNELQQAIGGQPDVDPGLYHGKMEPGDWVVVCSDGLTNHVTSADLQQMLQSEAVSAEMAARRLVNLTLLEGATDNVTVVAVRAT